MEATIKDTVKNIFKTNKFEDALDLTRNLRREYIHEYGVKSWNGLVTYYKNANIAPEEVVAEQEAEYPTNDTDVSNTDSTDPVPDYNCNVDDADHADADIADESDPDNDVETIEYMLYRNTGDKVEWFGHRENFNGLKIGDTARMIRMNNKGVREGMVVATNSLTLDDVALFHRCYGSIIKMKRSNKEQLELAAKCLMNLPDAINREYDRVPTSDSKLADYILNFKK